jgi:protein-tyrosine phosphatase
VITQDVIIGYTQGSMKEETILRQRVPLRGLLNTRELGGCPVTADGREKQVKWGLIYRSGSPEYITPSDRPLLEERKIKTVVDFRSEDEKTAFFNMASLAKKIELPIDAGNLMDSLSGTGDFFSRFGPNRAEAEMLQMYSVLPLEAIPPYRALFKLLLDSANIPILFHCSAGKDRTGLASALILYALGASMETIMENYLLSWEYIRPYWDSLGDSGSRMLPYYMVKKEYLLAAFSAIENYGGIDGYLANELNADVNLLRELYTEAIITP